MIKKIVYLKKINTPIEVYLSFFQYLIFDKFTKPFRKLYEKKYKNLLKNKSISYDWFSKHCFYFYWIIKRLKKEFKYLEIGVFEGNSFLFVTKELKPLISYAVDPWLDSKDEISKDMLSIEKNFDQNLSEKNLNFKKIKKTSDDFFSDNDEVFDVIYIDGSHNYLNVFSDANNSWKILNKNGILIFDDYFYHYPENPRGYVGFAINNFLNTIKREYKILLVTKNQIFIKKIVN